MKLSFDHIDIRAFKSFAIAELDFEDYGPGLHFFRGRNKVDPQLGSNGSGKSSLWDALAWCLFSRTPNGLRGTDVRPWNTEGTTQVVVTLHTDDVEHEVLRSAGPNKLMLDGKEVGQEQINALLGMDDHTFFNSILLGQGQPLFFDLEPRRKMELFSSVLNLEKWDTRASAASQKAARLEVLRAELTGEFNTLDNRMSFCSLELKQLQERSTEWEEDRLKRLGKIEGEVDEAKRRLAVLSKARDKADLDHDLAMTELKQLDKDHDGLLKKINEAHLVWERHDITIAKLKEEMDQIDFDLRLTPDTCSQCGQPIGGKERKQMRQKMLDRFDDLEDEIKADKKGPRLHADVQQLKGQEERLMAQVVGFRKKADDAKTILDHHTPLCIELEQIIKQRDMIEQELRDAANPYYDQTQTRKREQKKLKDDIAELQQRLDALVAQLERVRFWVKGFKDVRLYVIDDVVQELELVANAMLPDVGLDDWQIRFDIEKTTKTGKTSRGLNVTILSPDNDVPVRWESWSGGEGQRLRVIGALAFADVLLSHAGIMTDMTVLDEPTQHLSSEGVRDLCDFLMQRAQSRDAGIFYIDHQSVESARFQSVTTIVKDAKGSHLV